MKLRKVNYEMIVKQKIGLVQAGVKVATAELEAHFLSGGNVQKTALAVIAAHKAGIDLPWGTAAAIDLAGRDVLDAVRTSVNPKVIDCPRHPAKGKAMLEGVCKNGIRLKARARVTVRTKLERLIGGATEETIIARVGEGIVEAIGAAEHHTDMLANPHRISEAVLKKGLDSQTAFEIVSIDIAELDVGDNVGARLAAKKAASDLRVAQAQAEVRRAAAVAREQEMKRARRGESRQGRPGGGRGPAGHRPGLPRRASGRRRILQPAQRASRHQHAQRHRPSWQEFGWQGRHREMTRPIWNTWTA